MSDDIPQEEEIPIEDSDIPSDEEGVEQDPDITADESEEIDHKSPDQIMKNLKFAGVEITEEEESK